MSILATDLRYAYARGTVVELTRSGLHVFDEFFDGVRRDRGVHGKRKGPGSDFDDRREALHRVVGHVLEQADIRGEGIADHQKGMAIGCGPCDGLCACVATCAGLVLDDNRLAPAPLNLLSHNACRMSGSVQGEYGTTKVIARPPTCAVAPPSDAVMMAMMIVDCSKRSDIVR